MRQQAALILLAASAVAAGCTGQTQAPVPSGDASGTTAVATSPAPSLSLPDTDGPSVAPGDPPYTRATLRFVQVTVSAGLDRVDFGFTGEPKCVVTRLEVRPAGGIPVEGVAFLEVACSPAHGVRTPPTGDSAHQLPGESAAFAGRASSAATVNVIEAVQTSDEADVLVWTIGLRHSAPWGVGAIGNDPIIGIVQ